MLILIYLISLCGVTTGKELVNATLAPIGILPYVQSVTRSPVTVFVEEHIHLSCEIGGSPNPKIRWYKHDVLLNETRRIRFHNNSRNVEIAPAEYEDSGSYECIGSNYYGNTSASIEVVVKGAPVIVNVQKSPFIVEDGNHFDIFCYVVGNPYPTVSWTRNSTRVILNSRKFYTDRNQVLNFSPGRVSDSGMYQCNFENKYGTDKNEIEVIVGEAPRITWVSIDQQIIARGDTVMFYCVVNGSPAPNITWQSNNGNGLPRSRVEFLYDNMLMVIKNVSDSDAGSYTCKTSNIIGEDEKAIDLQVVDWKDVQWLEWSTWQCTGCTCGEDGGSKICRRRRSCIGTVAGANICSLRSQEQVNRETCSTQNCPGQWGQWSVWNCGSCSKTCGGGSETCFRNRTCPVNLCQGNGYESNTIDCNTNGCSDISSTTPMPSGGTGETSGSSVGLYAGAAAGVILVMVVIIIFIVVIMKRRKPTKEKHNISSNKPVNLTNSNPNPNPILSRPFNERNSRRPSGVYDQLHEPGMDENVYSTIDDYAKYTEIKELPEDQRPAYLELVDGKAVYSENGISNAGYNGS